MRRPDIQDRLDDLRVGFTKPHIYRIGGRWIASWNAGSIICSPEVIKRAAAWCAVHSDAVA